MNNKLKNILVIGGTGDLGKAVVKELNQKQANIIIASRSGGDIQFDITQTDSIKEMYRRVGKLDAVVCTPGAKIPIKPVTQMTKEDYLTGMQAKLLGQIDIVLIGQQHLNDHGSFTLTSGVLNEEPVPGGSCIAMVNSALEGFVTSAALELPRGLRLNIVSPKLLESSKEKFQPLLTGFDTVPDAVAAQAYLKCIYGILNATIVKVR